MSSARILPGPCGRPRQGSCRGLVGVLGRGLAGALSSGSYLGLAGLWSSQRSACHHARASRALVPMLSMVSELSGSRVAVLLVLGNLPRQGSCRGSVGRPEQGSCRGKPILSLCSSRFWLQCCSVSPVSLRPPPCRSWSQVRPQLLVHK